MLYNTKFRLFFYPFFFLALPLFSYFFDHLVWCNEWLFEHVSWCDDQIKSWSNRYLESLTAVFIIGLVDYFSHLFWFRNKMNKK